MKQLLRELKTLLLENKALLSEMEEEQRSMIDKKTEWEIYQDLKTIGAIDDDSKLNYRREK